MNAVQKIFHRLFIQNDPTSLDWPSALAPVFDRDAIDAYYADFKRGGRDYHIRTHYVHDDERVTMAPSEPEDIDEIRETVNHYLYEHLTTAIERHAPEMDFIMHFAALGLRDEIDKIVGLLSAMGGESSDVD